MNILANNTLKEMVEGIRAGRVTVIRNPDGSIKGIGVNNPELKVSQVRYVKQLGSGQAVGNTLAELEADEAAYREFARTHNTGEYMELAQVADTLASMNDSDVEVLARYIERNVPVKTVERRVEVPAPAPASRGRYENIPEELEALDVDELKDLKRTATRLGLNDLKNACRTALRHKGYNC